MNYHIDTHTLVFFITGILAYLVLSLIGTDFLFKGKVK